MAAYKFYLPIVESSLRVAGESCITQKDQPKKHKEKKEKWLVYKEFSCVNELYF